MTRRLCGRFYVSGGRFLQTACVSLLLALVRLPVHLSPRSSSCKTQTCQISSFSQAALQSPSFFSDNKLGCPFPRVGWSAFFRKLFFLCVIIPLYTTLIYNCLLLPFLIANDLLRFFSFTGRQRSLSILSGTGEPKSSWTWTHTLPADSYLPWGLSSFL